MLPRFILSQVHETLPFPPRPGASSIELSEVARGDDLAELFGRLLTHVGALPPAERDRLFLDFAEELAIAQLGARHGDRARECGTTDLVLQRRAEAAEYANPGPWGFAAVAPWGWWPSLEAQKTDPPGAERRWLSNLITHPLWQVEYPRAQKTDPNDDDATGDYTDDDSDSADDPIRVDAE